MAPRRRHRTATRCARPWPRSFLFSNDDKRFEISMTMGTADLTDPAVVERFSAALNNLLLTITCGTANPAKPMTQHIFPAARMG